MWLYPLRILIFICFGTTLISFLMQIDFNIFVHCLCLLQFPIALRGINLWWEMLKVGTSEGSLFMLHYLFHLFQTCMTYLFSIIFKEGWLCGLNMLSCKNTQKQIIKNNFCSIFQLFWSQKWLVDSYLVCL